MEIGHILSMVLECTLFKLSCGLDGFISSFEIVFWQIMHIIDHRFVRFSIHPM